MKKFLLYFLSILFLAAVGTLIFGFWRAKNIRMFAASVAEIKNKHDFSAQIEEIEKNFSESDKKDIAQIRDDSKQFEQKLDEIAKESQTAQEEIEDLGASSLAMATKEQVSDYFSKVAAQAEGLRGIIGYMSQIIDVAAIFGEMREDMTLEEIKNVIARAKEKSRMVSVESLPAELKPSAQSLKESMNVFLLKLDDTANLKTENTSELDAAYADFSQKENDFFAAAKKYIDGMENLAIIESGINENINKLQKIYFSLR